MQTNFRIANGFQVGLLGGLGVLIALLIGSAVSQTVSILTSIAFALFIALGLEPVVHLLVKWRLPRAAAVSIVVALFLLALGLLGWAIVPSAVTEAGNFIVFLPELLTSISTNPLIASLDTQLGGAISNGAANLAGFLSDSDNWPGILGGVLQFGLGLLNGVLALVVVVILTIYFMVSLEGMKRYTSRLVAKSKRERFTALTNQIANSVGRWVSAQVAIAFIHSLALFACLSLVGTEYSLLLAVLAFVLALIPLVGGVASAVLVTLVTVLQSPSEALIVGIYYLVYLQIEAYLISPRIMKHAVQVPAPIVVIAALMGGTLMGVLGALVAIPVAASLLLIVREIWMPRQQQL